MSTLRVNTLQNTSGVEVYTCKAWVNFNGTGTVAIRAAGNVSSITDGGTGDYTVNFTNSMPDSSYSAVMAFGNDSGSTGNGMFANRLVTQANNTLRFNCGRPDNGALADALLTSVAIFR